jgi:hypothetical protein
MLSLLGSDCSRLVVRKFLQRWFILRTAAELFVSLLRKAQRRYVPILASMALVIDVMTIGPETNYKNHQAAC